MKRYVPAVGQGALAIECREDDKDLLQLLAHINDTITERTVARSEYFFINLKVDAKFQLLDMQPLRERCNRINSSCWLYGWLCFIKRDSSGY